MFKKINNAIFVLLLLAVLFVPLVFTTWQSGGVSQEENRTLASFPALTVDGAFNSEFTAQFETWFRDHMGFRRQLIGFNQTMQEQVFDRAITTSDTKTGRTGDLIYAPDEIIRDYAHVNLRSQEEVEEIGRSYQTVSDWLAEQGIPFAYVQCVDKHTIYPERFLSSIRQIGSTSKTDQVLQYLKQETSVNAIYFKEPLMEQREAYPVFSHWGDPTHWTPRGAYLSYVYMMESLNRQTGWELSILQESDYDITWQTHTGPDGQTESVEEFTIREPKAQKGDVAVMGKWAEDYRHSVWVNPQAGNDKRLLLMGDSYIDSYVIDDIAESFGQVWMVWGDHTWELPEIVELYQPDLVIYECAERVDRSSGVCSLAEKLTQAE